MKESNPNEVHGQVTVCIDCETYSQIHAYVRTVPGELTLLGTAEPDPAHNEILVRHLFLPRQVSSACQTLVSEDALANLLVEAIQAGIDVDTLKVWLHSHGNMPVFFSGTDEQNIREAFPQSPWVLSLVVNRAGAVKARLSLFTPVRIDLDNLPVLVGMPAELKESIRQEVQAKVIQGTISQTTITDHKDAVSGNGSKPALAVEEWGPDACPQVSGN
jgi:hypothetical protein